jgi:hypothetical protein
MQVRKLLRHFHKPDALFLGSQVADQRRKWSDASVHSEVATSSKIDDSRNGLLL